MVPWGRHGTWRLRRGCGISRARPAQLQRNGLLRQINEQAIARLRRDWTALPQTLILEARLLAG